jgi:hypothetical protein
VVHKELVRLVITYASETWTLSKTDEKLLGVFKEEYSDSFLEQCRRMECGGKDTTMNYMSCLMIY